MIHVIPQNDLKLHKEESTCECKPIIETKNGEMILIHNSFDGRENYELDWQYQQYLKRMKLDECKMLPVQRIETKRAFMGGCGQMLKTLRDNLSELDEDIAIVKLQNMLDQVNLFFINETKKTYYGSN